MGIALHLSHFHISDFLSPDLQNPHLAALTFRSSGNWSPMSGAHQNYRKLGYKILDPAPTRISGLWDKVQWTHRQQPKWYSYAKDPSALLPCRRIGSNYQKKKGAEIKKYKTSKSRQEKEPVLWDFPAPSHWFSLDVRMHKDEGISDLGSRFYMLGMSADKRASSVKSNSRWGHGKFWSQIGSGNRWKITAGCAVEILPCHVCL